METIKLIRDGENGGEGGIEVGGKGDYTYRCTVTISRVQELCESGGGRPGLPTLIHLRFLWT